MMMDPSTFDLILSGVCVFGLYLYQRNNTRVDGVERRVNDLRVGLARAQQENKELQAHIKRIDKNISELFAKVDELLKMMQNPNGRPK
tara:strand:+ start:455 stop:718 length:264 start_codon:yes stop_codon:yes gene_type:complete